MSSSKTEQFLTLKAYRQKRLMDGVRLVPVLGTVALVFPLVILFFAPNVTNSQSATIVYLFSIWIALIAITFFVSRHLQAVADNQ